jgi:dihydrolipoamide dehydrogenase
MNKTDIIIIGGGPAGYLAAERAAHEGLTVRLFEKKALGGTCLNEGCIPTKSLLNAARIYHSAADGAPFGVLAEGMKFDHAKAVARKNDVVKSLVAGVGAKMKKSKADVIKEQALITGKGPDGFTVEAGGETYAADKLIIAAGSSAVVPPIDGVKEGIEAGYVLTSREALDIGALPEKLVVVGGGVIGLELASYFATVGCKVTVVEMLPVIGGSLDKDIEKNLRASLERAGISIKTSCKVKSVSSSAVVYEEDGADKEAEADKVLLSIGRKANTADLGLEALGIYTERGAIVTDEKMQTNVPGVYAVGDVNGKIMLAHTAYRESEVAINTIAGRRDAMDYGKVPSVLYTIPEAASVGETEESAKEKGIAVKTAALPMIYSGRYLAENLNGDGICKVVYDTKKDRVIGVQLIGSYASEVIMSAVSIINADRPLETIKKEVFPHPTVGEILRECIFEL